MAQKLLVITPQTTDGNTLEYDENDNVVTKKTILEVGARSNFQSLNAKLPNHLQHKFLIVEVDENGNVVEIKTNRPQAKKGTDAAAE